MQRLTRTLLLVFVMVTCVGCDQATKTIAKAALPASGPVSLLHNTMTLVYMENPGAFLSLGARLPDATRFALFTVATGLVLTGAGVFLLRSHRLRPLQGFSLALIIGGGLGNLMDRLSNHGCVVDFLRLGVGPVQTGVFNVADAVLMAGVITFGVATLWPRPTRWHRHAGEEG